MKCITKAWVGYGSQLQSRPSVAAPCLGILTTPHERSMHQIQQQGQIPRTKVQEHHAAGAEVMLVPCVPCTVTADSTPGPLQYKGQSNYKCHVDVCLRYLIMGPALVIMETPTILYHRPSLQLSFFTSRSYSRLVWAPNSKTS